MNGRPWEAQTVVRWYWQTLDESGDIHKRGSEQWSIVYNGIFIDITLYISINFMVFERTEA